MDKDLTFVRKEFPILERCVYLISNSLDAIEEKRHGRITIEAGEDENGFCIVVADSGPGIPPEEEGRVFDPFFTTKNAGTGLGLSIVRGIIEEHAGEISLMSHEGRGAQFRILLPRCQ